MQILFNSKHQPKDYTGKCGFGEYPPAPKKCPHKDCGIPTQMKKNGYYQRNLIAIGFCDIIRIRRYKCLVCGRTVSMLPSFCIAKFTYGVDYVIHLIKIALELGSIKKTVKQCRTQKVGISRRLVSKYLARVRDNRNLIQYGINQISPSNIGIGCIPGDTEWTKSFLNGIWPTLYTEFNANFQNTTGKSFMSLHIKIA